MVVSLTLCCILSVGRAGCDLLFHCTVKVVVLLLVGGI